MAKTKCQKCGKLVEQRDFDQHLEEFHPKPNFNLNEAPNPSKEIILISRERGTRISDGSCDNCGLRQTAVWHYKESNKGSVCLCGRCKSIVFDRSFGKVDAMSHAITTGFETNRRRH